MPQQKLLQGPENLAATYQLQFPQLHRTPRHSLHLHQSETCSSGLIFLWFLCLLIYSPLCSFLRHLGGGSLYQVLTYQVLFSLCLVLALPKCHGLSFPTFSDSRGPFLTTTPWAEPRLSHYNGYGIEGNGPDPRNLWPKPSHGQLTVLNDETSLSSSCTSSLGFFFSWLFSSSLSYSSSSLSPFSYSSSIHSSSTVGPFSSTAGWLASCKLCLFKGSFNQLGS